MEKSIRTILYAVCGRDIRTSLKTYHGSAPTRDLVNEALRITEAENDLMQLPNTRTRVEIIQAIQVVANAAMEGN